MRLAAIGLLVCAFTIRAEVKEVRTYHTREPRDRGVLFAMAVTPSGDVLSLVAKKDGKWRLARIRDWLYKNASEETIDVPGIGAADRPKFVSVYLLTPAGGKFAVAIAQGVTPGGTENTVSVIGPVTLKTLVTTLVRDNLVWAVDPEGRLVGRETDDSNHSAVVQSHSGRRRETKLMLFDVPRMSPMQECRFEESLQAGIWKHDSSDCASLGDSIRTPAVPVSPDGEFKAIHIDNFHRNWLDQYVTTELKDNVVAVGSGALVGTVKETTHDSVKSIFAMQNGQDYLLVMEGGTFLKIYQITGP